jgi:hypothetical protein
LYWRQRSLSDELGNVRRGSSGRLLDLLAAAASGGDHKLNIS